MPTFLARCAAWITLSQGGITRGECPATAPVGSRRLRGRYPRRASGRPATERVGRTVRSDAQFVCVPQRILGALPFRLEPRAALAALLLVAL
jgi:hypothetical protein